MEEARKVYLDNYEFFCNTYFDNGFLDTAYSEYADIFARNYSDGVWNISKWWFNYQKQPLATYAANFDFLKNWLSLRNTYLTRYFNISDDAYFLGDADSDTDISILDVTAIQKKLADFDITYYCENAADTDGEGQESLSLLHGLHDGVGSAYHGARPPAQA